MFKKFLRTCSMILTLVMLINMLPLNAWALGSEKDDLPTLSASDTVIPGIVTEQTDLDLSGARIVGEVTAKRTEYTKQFQLDNGLFVAAVYPQAVHYETDSGWEEIDNTLKVNKDGTYSNTAGAWDVRFPQQLSGSKDITVTKDGYTLSFRMAGELRQQSDVSVYAARGAAAETFQITENGTVHTFAVQSAQTSQGQIQTIDLTQAKAESQYEEFVLDKNASGLLYANVYANTNIRYDLQANRVKESVILERYSSTLRGYRYTLNTGGMIPVLQKDNSIHFYDANQENVVMVMPAPFLVDANDQYNYDVKVSLTGSGSSYTLIYTLPNAWLASAERAWPVVLDPEVTSQPDVLNIRDHTVASNGSYSMYRTVLECGYGPSNHIHHIYLKYRELPQISSSDVVIDAKISLLKSNNTANTTIHMEAHRVKANWESETITWANKPGENDTIEDYQFILNNGSTYTWTITDIVREWYAGQNYGVMFKASDATEAAGGNSWKQFYSSDCLVASQMPSLTITLRNNNGLEDYWDYTAASAGRAGTGYVNNYTGNLVWVRPDMGFDNNRMPVYINHIYNANDSTRNDFGLGKGWRTNYNQLVYQMEGDTNYYIWEDADGTRHYFKYNASTNNYKNEENLNLTLTVNATISNNTKYVITDPTGNTSSFDDAGRLIRQANNQFWSSNIKIAYEGDTKRISTITDGVGREYRFTYSSSTNLLSRLNCIYYVDEIEPEEDYEYEVSYMTFTYSSNQLTKITDKDTLYVTYGYGSNGLLQTAQNVDGCKLQYTYRARVSTFEPYRVKQVKEFDGTVAGGELNFDYANNQTTVTDVGGNIQIMQFNNFGNTTFIQDGNGNAQTAKYANNDASGTSSAPANQLTLASQLQSTVSNLFKDSSFEDRTTWSVTASTVSQQYSPGAAYYGYGGLYIRTTVANTGIQSASFTASPGEAYTFSAYVRTSTAKVYLSLSDGSTTVKSEALATNANWTRLQVTYKNTKTYAVTITARCIASTAGTFDLDCVQLEKAESASRYSLIENGDFRYGLDGWTKSGNPTLTTHDSATKQLDDTVCKITDGNDSEYRFAQTLQLPGEAGDIYTLTGWAKGDPLPQMDLRNFAIIATVNYENEDPEEFIAWFNPDTDSTNSWQYAAVEIIAKYAYNSITVELVYDHYNTAYFDGIQLYKESLGATYEYDNRGNLTKYTDVLGQSTTYTYNANDQLIQEIRPNGEVLIYEYDTYHNVKKITSSLGTVVEYAYTSCGNCKEISTTVDGITMVDRYIYSNDQYEYLRSKTSPLSETVNYVYSAYTGLLMYTTDGRGTQTTYTYDSMGRLHSETVDSNGSDPSVTYVYQDDQLSKAQTASTLYTFTYGNFSQISSIKAGSHTLATYHYNDERTDDSKNDLDRIDYGNGHSVKYVYDNQGRVIEEHYTKTNSNNTTTVDYGTIYYTYNSDGSLASVYDDYAFAYKYSYFYDSFGRVTQVLRGGSTLTTYTYTADNLLFRVDDASYGTTYYTYNQNRQLTSERNGTFQKNYTYSSGGILDRTAVSAPANTDYTVLTQNFEYYNNSSGSNGMLQSYEVSAAHYSRTLSYTYDNRGNIASVSNGTYTTSYVYDGTNQLVRENNQREGKTWVWEYDNAGNILCKKEFNYTTGTLGTPTRTINYTYGDSSWGDLLTGYGNRTITYDEIGNPLNDGLRTYTWERGRRVASINGSDMYYDSDGMLQEQSVGNNWYGYTYREGRLTRFDVAIGSNEYSMIINYDANGTPISLKCTAWYYDVDTSDEASYTDTYYYLVNPQGDVIGLTNSRGDLIVSYNYDAWGKLLSPNYGSDNSAMDCDVADLNPLRYRGYIYDVESGLYYLKSRYYDPEMGRFINADEFVSTGQDLQGYNMFAYCGNNPVARADSSGNFWNIVIGAAVGALVSGITTAIDSYVTTGSVDWGKVGISAAVGAISGGIAATGLGAIAQAGISAGASAIGSVATDLYERSKNPNAGKVTLKETGAIALRAVGSAAIGFGSSVFGTAAGKIVSGGLETKGMSMIFRGKISAGCWTRAQARNMVSQGKVLVNTARGVSSVVGTLFTWPTATALSMGLA